MAMFVHIFINKSYNSECKQVVPRTLIWLCNLSRWQKVLCVQESCGWALILYDSFLMQTYKFLVLEVTLFNEAHVSLLVLWGKKSCDFFFFVGKNHVNKATWIGLKSVISWSIIPHAIIILEFMIMEIQLTNFFWWCIDSGRNYISENQAKTNK